MLNQREITSLKTEQVAKYCKEQTQKFKQNHSSDSRFCFELLRRASLNLEEAWEMVFAQYWNSIHGKVQAHLAKYGSLAEDGIISEDLAQDALLAFRKHVLNLEKWGNFKSLDAVLAYMNKCAFSAVRDKMRSIQRTPR